MGRLEGIDRLSKMETYSIVLGSLLLALVLFLAGLFLRARRTQSGSIVLIVGPSDGGKTAIFSSLVYNHTPQTHTSLQQNIASYKPPSPFHRKPLQLIDIPGHPRIRSQFSDYLNPKSSSSIASATPGLRTKGVKGIIFVTDAAGLTRNASSVAEHLVLVMSAIGNLPPSVKAPPILVFANKADLLPTPGAAPRSPNTTLATTRTRTILERELEKRRLVALKTGGALNDLGEDEGGDDISGILDTTEGDSFSFEKWDGEIDVRSGWVDVKRSGRIGSVGESDEDSEPEKESHALSGKPVGEERDGLAELVDWIAALR